MTIFLCLAPARVAQYVSTNLYYYGQRSVAQGLDLLELDNLTWASRPEDLSCQSEPAQDLLQFQVGTVEGHSRPEAAAERHLGSSTKAGKRTNNIVMDTPNVAGLESP
ncbi:TPA: hypothetical protein ACH3X2_009816 [Trebouxia sp. C0005]